MATKHRYSPCKFAHWSYGAELELADWPTRDPLPVAGMQIDENERAGVNSNGVAVDGTGKLYHLGGEILTAPSESLSGPADQMEAIKTRWPQCTVNFRTGLNIHVRIPGLRDDLAKLKQIQTFIHNIMPGLLSVIDPIPPPSAQSYDTETFRAAMTDYRRCKKNHHYLMPAWRIALQMHARTPKEFFEAEAIHQPTGKVHWAIVLRACVNLRQLLQTDTIEFRHFPGSDSPDEILSATSWCAAFLEAALGRGPTDLARFREGRAWPKLLPYDPWLDRGYFYTSKFYHRPDVVCEHIKEWLNQTTPAGETVHGFCNEAGQQAVPTIRRRAD